MYIFKIIRLPGRINLLCPWQGSNLRPFYDETLLVHLKQPIRFSSK